MGLLNFFRKKPSLSIAVLQNDLRILNDCANLIENTTNPDVFFPRFTLYYEKLSLLANAQKDNLVTVMGDDILEKFLTFNTPDAKNDAINNFIKRYWDATCTKAAELKTQKGKDNCFENFKTTLSSYDEQLPNSCVKYYTYLYLNAPRIANMPRNQIPAEQIDNMQRLKASDFYCEKIYKMFFEDYPEMPFISQDRELNSTNWIEQAQLFGVTPSKDMMKRYPDGLLPGHIYMLYWLDKYNKKRIPVYFEYKYGINFEIEKSYLERNGYLSNGKPTEKGRSAISNHFTVIENHSPRKVGNVPDVVTQQIIFQKERLQENGFKYYEYIANSNSCPTCKSLDGKIFPLSSLVPGVNAPPMCKKCRCSITAYVKE